MLRRLTALVVAAVCLTGVVQSAPAAAAPSPYLQPVTSIPAARGCVVLTPGMNGIKVKLVQRRLGLPDSTWETMDSTTISRVKAFQRARGLSADGVVGPLTWRAMGFAEDFCFDRWTAQPALPLSATPAQRVETLVAYARTYLGAEYVWGGAGKPRYGIDCSGLVLQGLYRAGLDPRPISVDKHVLPDYRTSLELYAHPGLRHVALRDVRRGDLVFYKRNSTGRVNHVALYLGDGRLLEAKGPDVHTSPLRRTLDTQTIMPTVVRPFA